MPYTFPNPDNIEDIISKPIYIEKSSSNFTQSSEEPVIFTRTFKLTWSMLTATEKDILSGLFINNIGGNTSWVHPTEGVTYTVRLISGDISFSYVGVGEDGTWYYSTQMSILATNPV